MKIHVACGGTGGHVIPGITTVKVLRERGHDVVVWVAGRESEERPLLLWDGSVIRGGGRGMAGGLGSVVSSASLVGATWHARRRLSRQRCDAMLAMGGYACVPPALAARMMGAPVVLHEANAVPGRAVSFLYRCGCSVALSFESTAEFFPGGRACVTGFPVRTDLTGRFEDGMLREGCFTVLVMGGSQGARVLNDAAPAAIAAAGAQGTALQAIHIAGAKDEDRVVEAYRVAGVPALVFGFLNDIGKAYRSADFAVCRAGAATCAELIACRVPSLLVPLPGAPGDHQAENAKAMSSGGRADMMLQSDLSVETLAGHLAEMASNSGRLCEMRKELGKLDVEGAAGRLADMVEREVRSANI